MKLFLGLFTFLFLQSSYAEVYTCTYKGQTVYQGKPCPNAVKTKLNVPQTSLTDAQKYQLWKSAREPQIGMSGEQVIKTTSWGAPDRKRSYTTSRSKDELWYYSQLGYLTFTNGKVTSISQ